MIYNMNCAHKVINISKEAMNNCDFRKVVWTGEYCQMTVMCIPPCSDIGLELHKDTDQIIRIEQGMGLLKMWKDKDKPDYERKICVNDVVFVPAGKWHNIINIGRIPMKISSVYAPPHHPAGTIHRTKEDSEQSEH